MAIDFSALTVVINSIGIPNILTWLGFTKIKDMNTTVRASCAIHGGDRADSFCIYKNTLVWKCFSRKCEQVHGCSFVSLLAARLGCSKTEAISKFCTQFGLNLDDFTADDIDTAFYKMSSYVNHVKNMSEESNDIVFPTLLGDSDYFLTTKGGPFDKSTVARYGINKYYIDTSGRKRVFIPIFDDKFNLVAYSGRAEDDLKYRKYLNSFGSSADSLLYNIHYACFSSSQYMIVVEGYKSVWRLYEYGYNNVVSVLGSYLSPEQVKELLLRLKKIVLLFDNDEAGKTGMDIAISTYGTYVDIIPVWYDSDKDPADLDKEYIDKLLFKYKT